MTDPADVLLVFCTVPDDERGAALARALVDERLATCVNRLPGVQSVYRWQDAVESAAEALLLIKTRADRYPALADRVRALHPYELPELIAVKLDAGLPDYLRWVADGARPT